MSARVHWGPIIAGLLLALGASTLRGLIGRTSRREMIEGTGQVADTQRWRPLGDSSGYGPGAVGEGAGGYPLGRGQSRPQSTAIGAELGASRPERQATMDSMFETGQITAGIDVYGADGNKVGTIVSTQTDYIVVEQEVFASSDYSFPTTDYYIPISAIVSLDDGKVYLTVATDQVLNQGWDTEPVVGAGSASTGIASASSGSVADPGFTGADVLDDSQGFAAWSREHEATSVEDTDAAAEGARSIPFEPEGLPSTMRERDTGDRWVETDVFDQQRTAELSLSEERAAPEWSSLPRPVTASDADPFTECSTTEQPVAASDTEPFAATETGAESRQWSEWETDTAPREETRGDENLTVATTGDSRRDRGAGRRAGDSLLDDATNKARASKDAPSKSGARSRTQSGQLRSKRGDTLVGTIEKQHDVDFGVRSDMHLSTLLARRGVDSLEDLLSAAKSTASGGKR